MDQSRQTAWLPWISAALLVVLCAALAVLQYQWIGKTTEAERTRLHAELHARLDALARTLNEELREACSMNGEGSTRWFRRAALATYDEGGALKLKMLDRRTGELLPAAWPADWSALRDRLSEAGSGRGMGPPPPRGSGLIVLPRFRGRLEDRNGAGPSWWLLEIDASYLRTAILPQLVQRYLGVGDKLVYEAEMVENGLPARGRADDSVALFDMLPDGPRPHPDAAGFGGPPPPPDGGRGRWRLFVRHSAGSLETLVERTRRQNLAISAGILLLILAAVAMLTRFTRRAQQLAQQQIDFVAGVSHELRTPLTVIRTAAYNLRGKVAQRPEHVERYGALIQAESEKLGALVEQVLRFASIEAGHAIGAREPVSIGDLVDRELRFENGASDHRLHVEKRIEEGLPRVMCDAIAMRQALQNLVDNAVKYGAGDTHWIGVEARAVAGVDGPAVEIRVADRGPGIALEEQRRIFDPFVRGRRAVRDQVHGTGLGLSLAKKIVEAHGGTICVKSAPMKGAEFIVRIPSAPMELQNEPAHSIS